MADTTAASKSDHDPASQPLPRITIRFCTQCKWMLRAAYFAQELLSTFSTALGEVALQPATGGVFVVEIFYHSPPSSSTSRVRVLWDRKVHGGFPETKELKRRVRDVVEPGRNLGHVDRDYAPAAKGEGKTTTEGGEQKGATGKAEGCEDCK
ncbi:Rdx family-domain-containing protein [Xylariomycetidae sp. FL0641]|nr:Rdx family-domain-containing protein [Xylariomycetidae sp. FL0641]